LLPKCPFCIVAYIAMISGLGISVSTATGIQDAAILTCVGVLLLLAIYWLFRGSRENNFR